MTKIHFRPYNPNQTVLFPQRIDEDIAENDPVRMVDALVEGLNLESFRKLYKVVLPQAIRTMIPSIINQFIITLKDTSILSVIGFPELVNTAKNVNANIMRSLEVWFIVGVMYLIVITLLSRFAKRMERRLNRGRQ